MDSMEPHFPWLLNAMETVIHGGIFSVFGAAKETGLNSSELLFGPNKRFLDDSYVLMFGTTMLMH